MAKSALRLIVLRGPGEVNAIEALVTGRQQSLLINTTNGKMRSDWPRLASVWDKPRVNEAHLSFDPTTSAKRKPSKGQDNEVSNWVISETADEVRTGRKSLVLRAGQLTVAFGPTPLTSDPPSGSERVVVLDASWTHIPRFPDRDELREAFVNAFESSVRRFMYVTNLSWDADLFDQVAAECGVTHRCRTVMLKGFDPSILRQVRDAAPSVQKTDLVMVGLVPRRDDKGAYQRIQSDFAERTKHVRAFPLFPLSTGPGPSRDESLETVGLWLPTRVLVAGGPMSEQVLLARFLRENAGGIDVQVAVAGAEYRVPSLAPVHQYEIEAAAKAPYVSAGVASRTGLVVVSVARGGQLVVAGAGLTAAAQELLAKLKLSAADKLPDAIVRDVETAFSSRGIPAPTVRYVG